MLMTIPQVTSPPASPSSSPADSQQGSPAQAGYEVVTTYDQQGFPVVVTQPIGAASAVKHYNDQGFLITTSPSLGARSTQKPVAEKNVVSGASTVIAAADSSSATSSGVAKTASPATGTAFRLEVFGITTTAVVGVLCGMLFL